VRAAGFVGDDEAGRRLGQLLEDSGVATTATATSDRRPTVTKTRVLGGHQPMLRIDEEVVAPVPARGQARLIAALRPLMEERIDAVVLSDYDKGTLPARVCRLVIDLAHERGVNVLVDPKGRDFQKYARATTVTPNRHEFESAIGEGELAEPVFQARARQLRAELGLDLLAVTRGEKGVSLFDERGDCDFPAVAREVFDVSGAGDPMIDTLTADLVAGLDRDDALKLADLAAGVVVGKVGTAPIQREELLATLLTDRLAAQSHKVCQLDALLRCVSDWRARGERIVITNGCFDLLHIGHITLLARARREGDRLVVGINTDRSVRPLKGETRPGVTEGDRAQVLAGLSTIDAVVLFDEDTPLRLIEAIKPDVLVKGNDYAESEVVGADVVKARGGMVVLVPLVAGRSTTGMLKR
jgi:D-beta-D-heptose 7-phosphate kinase/D-beta-D-heptose 1-phosphate adenosyltransferase